jgi:hypothetical protein
MAHRMMTSGRSPLFTRPDAWSGSSYELGVVLGPRNDDVLRAAIDALWSFRDLDGCYERSDVEPEDQTRVVPTAAECEVERVLRGRACLPTGVVVPCSSIPVREEGGNDWLYFGLPLGSLGLAYPVGAFPFDDGSPLDWRDELDSWLRALATHVFARVAFRVALVGWTDADSEDPDRLLADGVPAQRWLGYVVPTGDGLRWYPPTEGAPMR